jgi:hypothetical protein
MDAGERTLRVPARAEEGDDALEARLHAEAGQAMEILLA